MSNSMTVKTKINHIYASIPDFESTISRFISRFESDGKIIAQNRRNTIKEFTLTETGERIVIKQYRNKGLLRIALSWFKVSKAQKAFNNGILLDKYGISTPAPIAYSENWAKSGLKACYYICRHTKDTSIKPLIEQPQSEIKAIKAFAKLMAKLHDNGIVHHDLNLSNVLYHTEGDEMKLSVIDINRVRYSKSLTPITSEKEYIDDLMRFTGRLDIFISVAYEYAKQRNIDAEPFVRRMTMKKIRHDANWTRKKKFHKHFKQL